jgi:hypothetical protein
MIRRVIDDGMRTTGQTDFQATAGERSKIGGQIRKVSREIPYTRTRVIDKRLGKFQASSKYFELLEFLNG